MAEWSQEEAGKRWPPTTREPYPHWDHCTYGKGFGSAPWCDCGAGEQNDLKEAYWEGFDALATAVAEVWTKNNGWVPGGSKAQLEEVLGLKLPDPAVGALSYSDDFVYKTDEPVRRFHGRETYAEWAERQEREPDDE